MLPVQYYIGLSAILFTLGALGVLIRRNAIIIFMSVELMLNAANLAFVAFARASRCRWTVRFLFSLSLRWRPRKLRLVWL